MSWAGDEPEDLQAPQTWSTSRRAAILGVSAAAFGAGSVGAHAQERQAAQRISSVADFGVVGDGKADDTRAVQTAYDKLAATGGGVLYFPRGIYRIELELTSRLVHICGDGRGITTLRAARPAGTVLRAVYAYAGWDAVHISDLTISGSGTRQGVGIACGHDAWRKHEEYVGQMLLDRVGFNNLEKAIARPFGNIGFYLDACTFDSADFHIWSTSNRTDGDPMHSGVLIATRCRFTAFEKAMFYLQSDNTLGGQIVFSDCVIEQGRGFVFLLNGFNGAGPAPGFHVRRSWIEASANGRDLGIEGKRYPEARFLLARDCSGMITIDDTPVGGLELINSVVQTRNCALDDMKPVIMDMNSQLRHHEARVFFGTPFGVCASIAGPEVAQGIRTPWFNVPLPAGTSRAYAQNCLRVFDGATPIDFTGDTPFRTVSEPGDAALPGRTTGQILEIRQKGLFWAGQLFDLKAGQWLVVLYIHRHLAGGPIAIQLSGSQGVSGQAVCTSPDWTALVNITQVGDRDIPRIGLLHTAPQGPARILLGGLAVMKFNNRQDAVSFANARLFPA